MASHPIATLAAYHDIEPPLALSKVLGLNPTSERNVTASGAPGRNAWFLEVSRPETGFQVGSSLAELTALLAEKAPAVAEAQAAGWEFEIRCYAQVPPHQSFALEPGEAGLLSRLGIRAQFNIA